jgi:hypothetical protein
VSLAGALDPLATQDDFLKQTDKVDTTLEKEESEDEEDCYDPLKEYYKMMRNKIEEDQKRLEK